MRPGKMRHRVALQRYTATQNSHGEEAKTYTALDTVWASVEPLTGKELLSAQQTESSIDLRVRVRYSSTISTLRPKDRVVFGSRTFEILSVINPGERNAQLELMCKERV